jgi:hypothetical protein
MPPRTTPDRSVARPTTDRGSREGLRRGRLAPHWVHACGRATEPPRSRLRAVPARQPPTEIRGSPAAILQHSCAKEDDMKDAAMMIGWDRPIPGKEGLALELFATAVTYFETQKKQGVIDSYEPVLLAAHAGDLNGFVLVRSAPDKLSHLRKEEAFLKLITKCNVALEGFGVIDAYRGDSLNKMMEIYRQSV